LKTQWLEVTIQLEDAVELEGITPYAIGTIRDIEVTDDISWWLPLEKQLKRKRELVGLRGHFDGLLPKASASYGLANWAKKTEQGMYAKLVSDGNERFLFAVEHHKKLVEEVQESISILESWIGTRVELRNIPPSRRRDSDIDGELINIYSEENGLPLEPRILCDYIGVSKYYNFRWKTLPLFQCVERWSFQNILQTAGKARSMFRSIMTRDMTLQNR